MRNVLELNIEGRYSESYEKQSMFGKEKNETKQQLRKFGADTDYKMLRFFS